MISNTVLKNISSNIAAIVKKNNDNQYRSEDEPRWSKYLFLFYLFIINIKTGLSIQLELV